MFKQSFTAIVASAMLATAAYAADKANYDAIYITDGQYGAALQQSEHLWRLLPMRGEEVDVNDKARQCGSGVKIARGLWYVTQDHNGRALLVAPSVTPLPAGFPEQVALRPCGEPTDTDAALFVPAVALEWISEHAGAVMIDD